MSSGCSPGTAGRRWTARTENDARRQLGDALLRGGLARAAEAPHLIAVLSAMDVAHKVIGGGDLPARQVKARAKEIA